MGNVFKIFFYVLLTILLFILCLYQFPEFSKFVDETTDSHISDDIKMKTNDVMDYILGKANILDNSLDTIAPNTKGRVD